MKAPTMDEWAEKLGTKALNGFVYEGRTLREWIDLMASGYCVVLPDGATNGDVVKAVFPNLEQDKERLRQKYGSQALYDTFEKWCELPYKAYRDCQTCENAKDGKCAGTEECHECMWDSQYKEVDNG